MSEFLTQHQYWTAVALYWIYSAAVSSLPFPADNSSPGYVWLYRFSHAIASNISTVFGNRIPGLKTLGLGLIFPLLLSTAACTAHYTIHPGALNVTDSAAYDTLVIAETAIDQARVDQKAGQLPDAAKEPLNTLIQSYNVARESWLTYRGALTTNSSPAAYFDQLTKNISDLTNAIRVLKEIQ